MATLCFLMRCDGDFSQEEREWLEDGLDYLKLDGGLPDDVKAKVRQSRTTRTCPSTGSRIVWRRGIPVAELARRVGVDGKRLWRVLNGERAMRADEFVRLCAELEVGLGVNLPRFH